MILDHSICILELHCFVISWVCIQVLPNPKNWVTWSSTNPVLGCLQTKFFRLEILNFSLQMFNCSLKITYDAQGILLNWLLVDLSFITDFQIQRQHPHTSSLSVISVSDLSGMTD